MPYHHEKTPVHRVLVHLGDERREFAAPWIAVDRAELAVHIYGTREAGHPLMVVPLLEALIEWHPPEAARGSDRPASLR